MNPIWPNKALTDVLAQARWQRERYGDVNEQMPDGTGPDEPWLAPVVEHASRGTMSFSAREIEDALRGEWDYPAGGTFEEQARAAGTMTWMRVLREEVAEAFAAEDDAALRAELVQVAAVALNWIKTIDRRGSDDDE